MRGQQDEQKPPPLATLVEPTAAQRRKLGRSLGGGDPPAEKAGDRAPAQEAICKAKSFKKRPLWVDSCGPPPQKALSGGGRPPPQDLLKWTLSQ